jgi:hypothetical protein
MSLSANRDGILVSRICHDLITPLNAISLGIELLDDQAILDSVKESSQKATALAVFFRELFSEKPAGFSYSPFSIEKAISDFLKFYGICFVLKSDESHISNISGKIIMYMSLISKEILSFGGNIAVNISGDKNFDMRSQDSDSEIVAMITGKGAIAPDMAISADNVNYKNIIRYNFMKLLENASSKLDVYQKENSVILAKNRILLCQIV